MTEPLQTSTTDLESYASRIDRFATQHAAVSRRWSLLGNMRLVVAVVLLFAIWRWWEDRTVELTAFVFLSLIVLIGLVMVQSRARMQRDALQRLITVNARAEARRTLNWNDAPPAPEPKIGRDHPYAWDLNVVGRASLAQRVGTPVTRHGWDALYRAVLGRVPTEHLKKRQAAVEELADEIDVRQQVEATGFYEEGVLPDPAGLIAWASSAAWLRSRIWLRALGWVGPLAFLVLFAGWATRLIAGPWFVIPIVFNGVVFAVWGGPAAVRVQSIVPLRGATGGYRDMFRLVSDAAPAAPLLREINQSLGEDAVGRMSALARIVSLAIPPGSIVYYPLQLAFLWDLHVLEALEGWQESAGNRVHVWLETLGEWEALAALSVLRRDHPDWAFPAMRDDVPEFTANAMAHPLLPDDVAVANDVHVGPQGTFLFVTGSNMSGKSTLLRAIGANAVLAQAGAPVRAMAASMPPMSIWTCMRVEDSLERGVSFFMAELQRLKTVVDGVASDPSRMALYLLDEILQGTNTGERQIASRRVLTSLVHQRSIGAVSSHDLALISGSVLEDAATQVHFAEIFERTPDGPSMTFDYQLRPGPATTSNALALMELLGFELGADESSPG